MASPGGHPASTTGYTGFTVLPYTLLITRIRLSLHSAARLPATPAAPHAAPPGHLAAENTAAAGAEAALGVPAAAGTGSASPGTHISSSRGPPALAASAPSSSSSSPLPSACPAGLVPAGSTAGQAPPARARPRAKSANSASDILEIRPSRKHKKKSAFFSEG
eukprot:gene4222-4524_t